MTKTLPITEARNKLPTLVNNANRRMDEYVITVNGSPAAVILSAAEYESWKETMDILADPRLVKDIRQGEEDVRRGRVVTLEQLKKRLKAHV